MILTFLLTTVLFVDVASVAEGPEHWRKLAQENILRYLNLQPNTNIAKNIVLMVGDGMGMSTVTAARILKGQLMGNFGEETQLAFETFPYTALSKVYTVDDQVPDSAGTMTAIVTGVKANSRTLGLDSFATFNKCEDITHNKLSTVLHWSQQAGKSTGFVTTSRVTHATPAALYAQTASRNWENDHDIPRNSNFTCLDIASQLVYNASDIQVILGGGSRNFIPNYIADPTTGKIDFQDQRYDGLNLLQAWEENKVARNVSHRIVHNTQQLQRVDAQSTDYLLGLFHRSHMSYEVDRDNGPNGEPSLAEMTKKAIEVLSKNKEGYFLMVEGARIDHGHHAVKAHKALTDTLAFEEAVEVVMNMTNESDTLLIVTADHSHVMTISGYPERGNGILDIVRVKHGEPTLAEDDLPYTTLSYTNGPKYIHPRPNLTNTNTGHKEFQRNTGVEIPFETHGGEDVVIYSRGPMAHLLTGVKEQNIIAHVMAHAACIGDTGIECETGRDTSDHSQHTCNCQHKLHMCKCHHDSQHGNTATTNKAFYNFLYVVFFVLLLRCSY